MRAEQEIQFENEDRNGKLRTTIFLQKGDRVKICRCMKSKTFPFCDGEHKYFDVQFGPVVVQVAEEEKPEKSDPSPM
jgi:CDGSH-type Zn-finger protein